MVARQRKQKRLCLSVSLDEWMDAWRCSLGSLQVLFALLLGPFNNFLFFIKIDGLKKDACISI